MNETAFRRSMTYSSKQDVVDGAGNRWTIRLTRSTDPANQHYDSVRGTAMMLRRIERWMRRRTRWNVEVLPACETDRRNARLAVQDVERTAAVEAAVGAARELSSGECRNRQRSD